MRDRLLAALLALTAFTVLLYGIPRSFIRAGVVHDEARRQVAVVARAAAVLVATRAEAGLPAAGPDLALFDRRDRVVYRHDERTEVLAGGGSPQTGGVVATVQVEGGGTVEVRRPDDVVREAVRRELLPIAATGALALAIAGGTAVLMARRMSRPFQLLAEHAADLGSGQPRDLPRLRVAEARSIGEALRASAGRLEATLRQERAFARNVAHQLRTPLTGVRLRVEGALLEDDVPAIVRDDLEHVLDEVDRLAGTIDALLAFSRKEHLGAAELLAPAQLVERAAARWRPLVEGEGRALQVGSAPSEPAPVAVGVVDQVLDVLLNNALVHGRGTIRVAARRTGAHVELVVGDEGTGVVDVPEEGLFAARPAEQARSGSEGVGLGLARQLASVVGGSLELVDRAPTAFALRLPTG